MPDNRSALWQSSGPENEVVIALPHIRLGARLWGDDGKPLLLALHGWLDNANSFEPLAAHLKDYQLLAIDWPGHGFSAHRPGAYPLHWIDYLYDLEMLIDHLSSQTSIHAVIGHSLGGIVASAYSAAFANKAPYWVFIEAASPLVESADKSKARLVRSFAMHRKMALRERQQPLYTTSDSAITARHRLTGLDRVWCQLLIERNMQRVNGGVQWRSDPRLKLDSPMRLNLEHVTGLMRDHQANVLLISANEGYKIAPDIAEQVKSWYGKLSHVALDGDHHLHMGNSKMVAEQINAFIA
ncbi:alpha/beta hydrolase [Shewanella colwelliana]|uniref:alpha/beta fold hydrolase n=1 Tax=Shewanella colwelliana TaxID=23 RepID=UPI001BBD223F|nr:alpha/beta hydrolase [Shewanella colwelliana]GIU27143.1 alpha/beta hydrolase [Shewanella colwelliana]